MSVITSSMNYIAKALNLIEKTCFDLEIDGHEHMRLLYKKYEKALYDAFIGMVRNNCKAYKNILNGNRVTFMIYGQLIDDKFTLVPNINTVHATLTKAMNDMFNRLKSVPRWLRTTNILCPFMNSMGTDESHLPYTYYSHVMKCEDVYNIKKECSNTIAILINRLKITMLKFEGFGFMYEKRNKLIIDQFIETNPTLADYGEKLKYFSTLSTRVECELYIDYGCVRIDISEYITVLRERCDFWHSVYANQLILECNDIMAKFSQRMVILEKKLNNHFRNCQGLDIVEKAVKKIRQTVFRADSTFHEIHNRFHFMMRHKITIPNYLLNNFKDVQNNWQILCKDALSRSLCFENAKTGLVTINSL
ncbi:dynein axonemal heavy chain 10-like [Rhopalosiphum padi]|uniref:dynein axonemal heavy chain 10-like n=1 Tax=Rhopalosiphum padi TaxID=40932 RepID=UPI00298E2873|nr:dynein axonemal heavy chain 10-like [Rhopalosiphum padi]